MEDRDKVLEDMEHSERHLDFGCYRCIKFEEVEGVICRRMHMGRVIGPDEIPMDFGKSTGRTG